LNQLPFALGNNFETIIFAFNLGIPAVYFLNFIFLYYKLRNFGKDAPFYHFVRSLVFFFFFYGLGSIFFIYYDFFYMQFESPDPIAIFYGTQAVPANLNQILQMWKIGILLQNIGLLLMLNALRGKILAPKDDKVISKLKLLIPVVWQIIGISLLLIWGIIDIPGLSIKDYYYFAEINFLFNFSWSISLPLTYGYIYKISAGTVRKCAFILFLFFISYGLAWGFRTRFAVYLGIPLFAWLDPNPMNYHLIWLIRAVAIDISLLMVFVAYRKLLKSFK